MSKAVAFGAVSPEEQPHHQLGLVRNTEPQLHFTPKNQPQGMGPSKVASQALQVIPMPFNWAEV